jgi:NAD dependent epimerase/dehydratase family enzyme
LDTLYTPGAVTAVQWDPNLPANTQRDEAIANALDGCAAVFQFAGEPVFRSMLPVTRSQLDAAMFGRTHIVRRLGKIIRDLPNKPGVFVNASSIGYYGFPSKVYTCFWTSNSARPSNRQIVFLAKRRRGHRGYRAS